FAFLADAAQHKLYSYIGSPETLVKEWYSWTSFLVTGPGLPVPITRPSIFTIGTISAPVPVRKHSSALNRSYRVKFGSLTLMPEASASSITTWRVIPYN